MNVIVQCIFLHEIVYLIVVSIVNFDILYSSYSFFIFYYFRFYLFCITISSKLHQPPSRLVSLYQLTISQIKNQHEIFSKIIKLRFLDKIIYPRKDVLIK